MSILCTITLSVIFLKLGFNIDNSFNSQVTLESLVEFALMYIRSSSNTLFVDVFKDLNIVKSSGVQKANDKMKTDMCLLCRCPSFREVYSTSIYNIINRICVLTLSSSFTGFSY